MINSWKDNFGGEVKGIAFDFNAIVVGMVTMLNNEVCEKIEEIEEYSPAAAKGEEIIDNSVRPDLNQVVYATLAKALPTFIRDTYDMCEHELLHNKEYFKMLDGKIAAVIQENELGEDVEDYLGDQLNQWKTALETGSSTLRVIRVGDEEEGIEEEDEEN